MEKAVEMPKEENESNRMGTSDGSAVDVSKENLDKSEPEMEIILDDKTSTASKKLNPKESKVRKRTKNLKARTSMPEVQNIVAMINQMVNICAPELNSTQRKKVSVSMEQMNISCKPKVLSSEAAVKSLERLGSSSVRFKVMDMEPNKWQPTPGDRSDFIEPFDPIFNISCLPIYGQNKYQEVLQASRFTPQTTFDVFGDPPLKNALIKTMLNCWNGEHNFAFRTDDFWTAIATQLSFYFLDNAESLRSQFVRFKGTKVLKIEVPESDLRTLSVFTMIKRMVTEISKNLIDKEFVAWFMPKFNTTEETDTIVYGIALMAAMKNYFTYNLWIGGAPVPSKIKEIQFPDVTPGNDWHAFLTRLDKLSSFNLESLAEIVSVIATNFMTTRDGQIDVEFWTHCCHFVRSKSPEKFDAIIGGWITAFCCIAVDGQKVEAAEEFDPSDYIETESKALKNIIENRFPVMNVKDVPSSLTFVDVNVYDVKENDNHKVALLGGSMGFEIINEERGLRPVSGWAFTLKEENNLRSAAKRTYRRKKHGGKTPSETKQ